MSPRHQPGISACQPQLGPALRSRCAVGVDRVEAPGGSGAVGSGVRDAERCCVAGADRLGARWAWYALWLLPVTYGAIAARQLADQYAVGYFYIGLAAVAGIGLLIEMRGIRRPWT